MSIDTMLFLLLVVAFLAVKVFKFYFYRNYGKSPSKEGLSLMEYFELYSSSDTKRRK